MTGLGSQPVEASTGDVFKTRTPERFAGWHWSVRRKPRSLGKAYTAAFIRIDQWLADAGRDERLFGGSLTAVQARVLIESLRREKSFRALDAEMSYICSDAMEEYVHWVE